MVEREDWKRTYESYHPKKKYYITLVILILMGATFFLFQGIPKPTVLPANITILPSEFSISYKDGSLYIRNEGNYTIPAKNISVYINNVRTSFTNNVAIEPGEIIIIQGLNVSKSTEINITEPSLTKKLTIAPYSECEYGLCCSTEKKFKDSSYICQYNFSVELGCPWGTAVGSDVGIRYSNRYCLGNSPECSGIQKWGDWSLYTDCNATQYCSGGLCTRFNTSLIAGGSSGGSSVPGVPSACSNECNENQVECVSSGYRTCGNYDNDACFEWSYAVNCPANYECISNICILRKCPEGTPFDQCSSTKPKFCQNGTLTDYCSLCGCPSGYSCQNNTCSQVSCTDECSAGQKECYNVSSYMTCGNYDSDACLEFGNITHCPSNYNCSNGNCTAQALSDTTPPTGSISINSGADYTTSASVMLALSCSDSTGCIQMQFSSNSSTYSAPEPYNTTKPWLLPSGDGTKTVYARFKDGTGNWMLLPVNDTIILDTTFPVRSNAAPTGTIASTMVNLSLTTNEAAACRYSTAAGTSYDLMASTFSTTGGTSHLQALTGMTEGTKNYYVRCKDAAGNKNSDDYTISFTIIQQTCGDGTLYGNCSSTKPKYCSNGILINRCSQCSCPSGQICQADNSCITGSVDMDLTYIRRTPEYTWDALKNWPDDSEQVTFTAHVMNRGTVDAAYIEYKWQVYDEESKLIAEQNSTITGISQGQEATAAYNWLWKDGPKRLKFIVDPNNKVTETYENNNDLEEYTNSYLAAFKVERTLYDWFNSQISCQASPSGYFVWANGSNNAGYRCGTKSWEDWAQRQIKQFNEFLEKAENDYSLVRHSLPRVKINRLDIVDDDYMYNHGDVYYHNCPYDHPEKKYYAMSWGFEKTAWAQEGHPSSINWYSSTPEWLNVERPLLHELGHNLNRPHLDAGKLENGQVRIQESGSYVFPQTGIVYMCDKEMCTDHIMQNPGSANGFSKYNALGMKYQLGYQNKARKVPTRIGQRNGCEWGDTAPDIIKSEFQLPLSNKIRVIDKAGNPIPDADVNIYRSQPQEDWTPYVDNIPDLTGKTDSQGLFDLGQYPLAPSGTAWSRIGRSLVIKIAQGSYTEYRFLDIMHMNIELWSGNNNAIYDVDTKANGNHEGILNLGGKTPDSTNLALNRPATASSGSNPQYAVDGDKTTTDQSWEAPSTSGSWWKVDLGSIYSLYKIGIYPHIVNPHDWYQKFHIEVSTTGDFTGEQTTVATETNWDASRGSENYMIYTFNPVQGRYVRIVSDTTQSWARLQEVEIYRVT